MFVQLGAADKPRGLWEGVCLTDFTVQSFQRKTHPKRTNRDHGCHISSHVTRNTRTHIYTHGGSDKSGSGFEPALSLFDPTDPMSVHMEKTSSMWQVSIRLVD